MDRSQQPANRPITAAQRETLIAAHERTGNVRAAMREAGIRSPRTAYLWLRRHREGGATALQPRSHARKAQRTVPGELDPEITKEIVALRRERGWGRRRIALTLAERHGRQVVSPYGVEVVLRGRGLWHAPPTARPGPVARPPLILAGGGIDRERLLARVAEGLGQSLRGEARAAVETLGRQVWGPLERARANWGGLLSDRQLGPLLLRSRVQLGHSLMNAGDWLRAASSLQYTIDWMGEHEPTTARKQSDAVALGFPLGWDNLWVEGYQLLAVVERDSDRKAARGFLRTTLAALERRDRPRTPLGSLGLHGNLERDLGKLLVAEGNFAEAERHYRNAERDIEREGDAGMLAAAVMSRATLHSRRASQERRAGQGDWRGERRAMEEAIERVLGLMRAFSSPILETIFTIDAAQLRAAHGMPLEGTQLGVAAGHCLTFGYRHQARQLLALRPALELLPGAVVIQLTDLVARTAG